MIPFQIINKDVKLDAPGVLLISQTKFMKFRFPIRFYFSIQDR